MTEMQFPPQVRDWVGDCVAEPEEAAFQFGVRLLCLAGEKYVDLDQYVGTYESRSYVAACIDNNRLMAVTLGADGRRTLFMENCSPPDGSMIALTNCGLRGWPHMNTVPESEFMAEMFPIFPPSDGANV